MTIVTLIIYLLILILIAYKSNQKVSDFNDFFVAGKKGSYLAITGSLIATILGGSAVIGSIDAGKNIGWASSWFMLSASLGLLALIPLSKKISKMGRFTLPDLLNDLYGRKTKLIASVIIPIAWLGIVAAQIIAAAKILESFTAMPYEIGVLISGVVFIAYTVAGGQISILKTDSFQAGIIIAGLISIAGFAFFSDYSNESFSTELKFPFNPNFRPIDLFILIITYATTFTVGPDMFSRIFCARNSQIAQKSILTSALILVPIALIIGFLSVVDTTGNHGAKLINISMNVLPFWLSPLVVITLLSAVLSSADTTLLSASIIVTDLLEKNNFSNKSLKHSRIVIILIGIASIAIAYSFDSIIEMLLIALTVYSGAFTIPIISGLAGVKTKPSYVSAAIAIGGIVAFTGKLLTYTQLSEFGNAFIITAFFISGAIITFGAFKFKIQHRK